jgi:hypothetical protein
VYQRVIRPGGLGDLRSPVSLPSLYALLCSGLGVGAERISTEPTGRGSSAACSPACCAGCAKRRLSIQGPDERLAWMIVLPPSRSGSPASPSSTPSGRSSPSPPPRPCSCSSRPRPARRGTAPPLPPPGPHARRSHGSRPPGPAGEPLQPVTQRKPARAGRRTESQVPLALGVMLPRPLLPAAAPTIPVITPHRAPARTARCAGPPRDLTRPRRSGDCQASSGGHWPPVRARRGASPNGAWRS